MASPLSMTLLVGVGGFAGAIARYGLSVSLQRVSLEWPVGTLAANVLGCLLVGVLAGVAARGEALSPAVRLALATGFCGGFTTMSSMIYETAAMLRDSEILHAALYVVGTFALSLVAFVVGVTAVRALLKMS